MGNPIQSIRIIYEYAKKARDNDQPLSNHEIEHMLNIAGVPQDLINRYPRFQKGYASEDLFLRIYSLLPWIKNIVPLGQEQFPEYSKEATQISDYLVTYEVGSKDKSSTLLIEAKLVDEKKQTHVIKKYQYDVLNKYSEDNHIPLLFALFWKGKGIWTINSIEVFDKKCSEYKISYGEAIRNDLSSIFGDYIYVFDKPFYRLSCFNIDPSIQSYYLSTHEKLGKTVCEKISYDNDNYKSLEWLFSPVIDCIFDMSEVSRRAINSMESELIEKYTPNTSNIITTKLSSLMYAYLVKLWCVNKEDLYFKDIDFITNTFHIVDTARREILGKRYYLLPAQVNTIHNDLIKSQFGGVRHIMQPYLSLDRKKNFIICSPHDENETIIMLHI